MAGLASFEGPNRLTNLEKNIHHMKSRLWEGIVPLSHNRWRALRLDEPENFRAACQHLDNVITTFKYLNVFRHVTYLREAFNLVSKHLGDFEAALNSLRATKGKEERISMNALWEEYIRAHFQVITTRAHSWVLDHINTLRQPIIRELLSHQPPSEDDFTANQLELTNRLHDLAELAAHADFTTFTPMHGYVGWSAPYLGENPELKSLALNIRCEAYRMRLRYLTFTKTMRDTTARLARNETLGGISNPASLVKPYTAQIEAQDELRIEVREVPEPMPAEG